MENIIEIVNNKSDVAEKPQRKWLTADEVYIQDINGKLWKTEDWDGSVNPNAIAVITPQHKFRIALIRISFPIAMSRSDKDKWEKYLSGTSQSNAQVDYNGVTNTQLIVTKCQSSTEYAAGACNAYIFPDGSKGYLPALGELLLAYQNKEAIAAALSACGGIALSDGYYWSSTFFGVSGGMNRNCWWGLNWYNGAVSYHLWHYDLYVRAFAPLEI